MLQISSALVKGLFCSGNILDSVEVFARFLKKPEVRHLTLKGCPDHQTEKCQRTITAIVENIKDYLNSFLSATGSRKTLEQQAFRTVVTACSGSNLRQKKLMTQTSRALAIHPRNVLRGVRDRSKLEELAGSGFVMCTKKTYRNKMPDKV